jgi:hypothetical protein
MTQLTAQAFRDLLSSVRDSISSLKSCQERELPNERRLLENVVAELRAAAPLRRNDDLIERKVLMLAEAQATLTARPVREVLTFVLPEETPTVPLHEQLFQMGDRYVSWEFLMST